MSVHVKMDWMVRLPDYLMSAGDFILYLKTIWNGLHGCGDRTAGVLGGQPNYAGLSDYSGGADMVAISASLTLGSW